MAKPSGKEQKLARDNNAPSSLTLFRALVIIALGIWIYAPAFQGASLGDDDILVFGNNLVRDPNGLWRIWFDPANSLLDYQPIKFSMVCLQWHLWGDNTLGYHLTNVALHLASCLLLWRLLAKFGLRWAWIGGLIFATHPVIVESVAWISEFKNTLSLPPFLLAMIFWIDFEDHRRPRDYVLALGLFLVALLCKGTMIMFPVVILLYAWWKRGKIGWNDFKLSAPFFAVSLVLGYVIDWFLIHHAIGAQQIAMGGPFSRLALANLTTTFYFSKCIVPIDLMPVYPRWIVDPPSLIQFLPLLVFAGLIGWFWTKRRSWGRDVLLGLGFFLINLAPFVGFISGSYMAFSWVTDHTLYIPIIGLIGLAVAGLERLNELLPRQLRFVTAGLMVLVAALLAIESHTYAGNYRTKEIFCDFALKQNPNAVPAHLALGLICLKDGRTSEALHHGLAAVELDPDLDQTHVVLGDVYLKTGSLAEAEEQFGLAQKLGPDNADAQIGLGSVLAQTGRFTGALDHFNHALTLRQNDSTALSGRGEIKRIQGALPGALADLNQSIALDPAASQPYLSRGVIEKAHGDATAALADLRRFRELAPRNPNADYAQLWIWIIRAEQKDQPAADQELSSAKSTSWNATATDGVSVNARFLLGQIEETDFLAGIDTPNKSNDLGRLCEARYYVAIKRLLAGEKMAAITAFHGCLATGKTDYFEYTLAQGELNALGTGN
jgi:tetratricopeptide (TPR) repeat protein